jgi:hypothetical protein
MERMTVLQAFDEYEGDKEIRRAKGDHLTVSAERAEHLRSEGLARSLPKPAPAAAPIDPGTAE